jgi:hypothetical protein
MIPLARPISMNVHLKQTTVPTVSASTQSDLSVATALGLGTTEPLAVMTPMNVSWKLTIASTGCVLTPPDLLVVIATTLVTLGRPAQMILTSVQPKVMTVRMEASAQTLWDPSPATATEPGSSGLLVVTTLMSAPSTNQSA